MVIGEETRFTGRAVVVLVSALLFVGGVGVGILQRLSAIETRITVLELKVDQLNARGQHASNP